MKILHSWQVEFSLADGVASFRAAEASFRADGEQFDGRDRAVARNRKRLVRVRKGLSYAGWACACAADADLLDQARCALFCEP